MPTTKPDAKADPILASTLALCRALIARPSVTPDDAGCQRLIQTRLEALGLQCRQMPKGEVSNLWAVTPGEGPLLVFAGHTDVVPTGPLNLWASPPFAPVVRDGLLFGRGSADMKSGLAAMITAAERLLASKKNLSGRLGFLITSDEEGPAIHGTKAVIEQLQAEEERIRWCIIGEPSSIGQLGDQVRVGRRGSLNCVVKITGKQGHAAHLDPAINPIHLSIERLNRLIAIEWDKGNEHFAATRLQVSNIRAGTGAANVIPGQLEAAFNLRFNTEQTVAGITAKVEKLFSGLPVGLDWQPSGEPFLTEQGELTDAICAGIKQECGRLPALSTGGGTSDGRFIAPAGAEVVELGPVCASIHQIDEHCRLSELAPLSRIYEHAAAKLLHAGQ